MTRWWKLMVFAAAMLGLHAFFEPFFQFGTGEDAITASAFRIRVGFDGIEQVDPALGGMDPAEEKVVLGKINDVIQFEGHVRGVLEERTLWVRSFVPYYFLATAGLLLIAFIAVINGRLDGLSGLAAIVCGLISVWGYMHSARLEGAELQRGAQFLLLSGILATVAGVGNIWGPDPGGWRSGPPRRRREKPAG